MGSKKHKKHKSDRWGRYESAQEQGAERPQLRLILKVGGGSSTPEADQSDNSASFVHRQANLSQSASYIPYGDGNESRQSFSDGERGDKERHKKKKEKKKKKNKDKDKDRDRERKKHKHHHKDKKHKEKDESMSRGDDSMHYEVISVPPPKTFPAPSSSAGAALSPRPILKISTAPPFSSNVNESATLLVSNASSTPAPRPSSGGGLRTSLRPRQERPALQKLLELLLPVLERKDPRQFFAWPVTDSIAPGYSTIITKPMDFSTMKQKIEENDYKNLQEFSNDFTLMCNNAMVYNQPDTIYYKAAKRLLHNGQRLLSPDKVRPLVPTISNFGELTVAHLGFEPLEESFRAFQIRQTGEGGDVEMEAGFSSGGETMVETARDTFLKNETAPTTAVTTTPTTAPAAASANNTFDVLPDDMTPDEILEQVQEAVQVAAVKLESQHPRAKMGFLRQRKDGTTSLAILAPCDPSQEPGCEEVPVTLGMLTGKVQPGPGSGQLLGFREDRRNLAKGVKPIYYGPFGSYAPTYDSTFANLSKEESELVYSTYGEETGVQYAESILDFVRDCDYALHMADDLLTLMTHGEHLTVAKILEDKRRVQQQQHQQLLLQQQLQQQQNALNEDLINFKSLRSLEDLGIDVSFLDSFEAQLKAEQVAREVNQTYLDETGTLISNLEKVQRERLSKTPPPHLSNIAPPSDLEIQLAEKITEGITLVAKQALPAAVASLPAVRKAMGISKELPISAAAIATSEPVAMETDQRDLESELSKLLGEDDPVADVMTSMFQ
nr:EOG090X04G3 [Sida crystallina]